MLYYINVKQKNLNSAGDKAPRDISEICKMNGMKSFNMPQIPSDSNTIFNKIWLFFVCLYYWSKLWIIVNKDDIVLYQHPMYGNRMTAHFVPKIQKHKNCKFIAVIHDLESLRNGVGGDYTPNPKTSELSDHKLLKQFDVIICHNEHMKEYLIQQGFDADKLVCLGIFDYLCDCKKKREEKGEKPSIAIAGNLGMGKCAYIYDIINIQRGNNANLTIHLYGKNFEKNEACEGMIYHGSFPPEELPKYLKGDFGLVWDGTSSETCEGNTGEYLKYNNPHKTSLYLASGMPVIVWKEAAITDFVLENGVGITVENLDNLDEIIAGISNDEYKIMCENASKVGEKIRKGVYFTQALEKCLKKLRNNNR